MSMGTKDGNLVLVMKHVFKASPERLFDAWTKPELMTQWFHADETWSNPLAEADLRVEGDWKLDMKRPDGKIYPHSGRYKVIERPHKLVFTWHPHGDKNIETLVTLSFKKVSEDSTELTLTHEGLRDEKMKDDHNGGWTACLGNLGRVLEKGGLK